MTANVDFFCTKSEEQIVIRYLLKDKNVVMYDVFGDKLRQSDTTTLVSSSDWESELSLFFLHAELGDWVLHATRPHVELNANHGQLVASLLARERWDQSSMSHGEGLIDFERSPALVYRRGQRKSGRIRASRLTACPSRLSGVSVEYEKWVKRALGWVRRKGEIVHDYRTQSRVIPNPDHLLTTTYAWPEAKAVIDSGNHLFEIGI